MEWLALVMDGLPLGAVAELLTRNTQLAERLLAVVERQAEGMLTRARVELPTTREEEQVLEAIGDERVLLKTIAARLRRSPTSGSFRDLIRSMRRHKLLSKDRDGYFARGPYAPPVRKTQEKH